MSKLLVCIFDKNRVTTRSEALDAYKNYCDVLGLTPESEQKFTTRLKETPKISVTLVRKPKQERAWKGLGLKTINDDGKITQLDTLDTPFHPQTIVENFKNIEESGRRVSCVSPVSNPEVYKDRYCSKECSNFGKPSCAVSHWQIVNEQTLLPLKCIGYNYVGAQEEAS